MGIWWTGFLDAACHGPAADHLPATARHVEDPRAPPQTCDLPEEREPGVGERVEDAVVALGDLVLAHGHD